MSAVLSRRVAALEAAIPDETDPMVITRHIVDSERRLVALWRSGLQVDRSDLESEAAFIDRACKCFEVSR